MARTRDCGTRRASVWPRPMRSTAASTSPPTTSSTTAAPNTVPPAGGDYTYPAAGAPYFKNAADLVEVRVQPLAQRDRVRRALQHARGSRGAGRRDRDRRRQRARARRAVAVRRRSLRAGRALCAHDPRAAAPCSPICSRAPPRRSPSPSRTTPARRSAELENTFTTSVPLAALGLAAAPASGTWRLHAAAGLWSGSAWAPQCRTRRLRSTSRSSPTLRRTGSRTGRPTCSRPAISARPRACSTGTASPTTTLRSRRADSRACTPRRSAPWSARGSWTGCSGSTARWRPR